MDELSDLDLHLDNNAGCLCDSCLDAVFNDDAPSPRHDADDEDCQCDTCVPWVQSDALGSFSMPIDLTADTDSEDDSSPPASDRNEEVSDSSSESYPDSPTYSPSSPAYEQVPDSPGPHVLMPCWHNERCGNGNEFISVVDDRNGLGNYECVLCCLHWRQRHHAMEHFLGSDHSRRLAFLQGAPTLYCLVCDVLPTDREAHRLSHQHEDLRLSLGRPALVSDIATRRVIVCTDGRRRAMCVEYPAPGPYLGVLFPMNH